ncbi:MAG TPA: MOSC domain-containing protein [Opitutaceae bacterium]|nr:MOSC domain-containing protein [Opitutaceae bacterium]
MMRIRHIFVSAGHNFFGHYGQPAGRTPATEVDAVECVAGRGLRGDRFFGYRPDYKGQVTFFSAEVAAELRANFGLAAVDLAAFRRNIITEGLDLNSLIGRRFALQAVELEGAEECRPCFWMDQAIAPGAEEWLKGRGGLRCRILSDGWLRRDS